MNSLASSKMKNIFIGITLVSVATIFISIRSFASDSPTEALLLKPTIAVYRQRDTGDYLKIVFAVVNSGKEEVTIVTEHLDSGFFGIDKDTNSLRCILSFDSEIKYEKEHRIVPSIYKYAPVTLKPGEAAMVNYYRDYSKTSNRKGIRENNLEADNIIITYKISSFWAERFNLWQGEIQSSPIEFKKTAIKR